MSRIKCLLLASYKQIKIVSKLDFLVHKEIGKEKTMKDERKKKEEMKRNQGKKGKKF